MATPTKSSPPLNSLNNQVNEAVGLLVIANYQTNATHCICFSNSLFNDPSIPTISNLKPCISSSSACYKIPIPHGTSSTSTLASSTWPWQQSLSSYQASQSKKSQTKALSYGRCSASSLPSSSTSTAYMTGSPMNSFAPAAHSCTGECGLAGATV